LHLDTLAQSPYSIVTQYRPSILCQGMTLSRDLFLGFVGLHILYRAGKEPVYGLWLIEELARHGYDLSAGTLYPMLHNLEDEGLLLSHERVVKGERRRYYTRTVRGTSTFIEGRVGAIELLGEIRDGPAED